MELMALNLRLGIVLDHTFTKDVRVKNELDFICTEEVECGILSRDEAESQNDNTFLKHYPAGSLTGIQKFKFISETRFGLYTQFWENKIRQFISAFRPNLLHVHDLYLLRPALEASESKVPVIVDLHENYPAAFRSYSWTRKFPHRFFVNPNYWELIEKEYLPKASGIIVLSDYYRKQLVQKIPGLSNIPIAVYPNVPDIEQLGEVREMKLDEKRPFRILYFGMIGKTRGLHIVSQAVRKLLNQGVQVEFIAVGAVHKSDRTYFENEVLGPGVRHIPWIELNELGEVLRNVDACISPIEKNDAHESGIANKVFQYMYFKKPVLVSDCIPQEQLVLSTKSGLSYSHDDPNALEEAIKALITNPQGRKEMGENGHKAVMEKYNSGTFGLEIIRLYQSLLRDGH
jgi:glycosyltransferase involved in cell wall biosynthesis